MNFFQRLKSNTTLILFSSVLILFNYLFTKVALLDTFGYEFAAVNGLLLVIISGLYTIDRVRKTEINFRRIFKHKIIFLLIPLIISIIHSLLTMFCSFWDGLLFYLLIAFPSLLFGSSLALLVDLYFRKFKRLVFVVLIFLIALIPIIEIYIFPQVYFYSPLIGFFPGNIYDEGLSPDFKLFWHQIIVMLFSVLCIYLIVIKRSKISAHKYLFLTSLLGLFLAFQFVSPHLGFSTTFNKLENILNQKIETEKFVLHYDKLSEETAEFISITQEYYYTEISDFLKVHPSEKINVYIFNDRDQKKKLFGAGNADVAKPWQYSVYISADSWENTLKHELAHVFSAEFGTGIFRLASGFNPALIEGIAEAVEGTSNEFDLLDITGLAFQNNYNISIAPLFRGLNFFGSNSSLGYTYSGAFIKHLIEKYGVEKVKVFYSTNDFESIFKIKITDEQKNFEEKLFKRKKVGNQQMADYYFGRLSILQKICPRYISDRLTDAFNYLSENDLNRAEELFNEINRKTLNYSALIGLSEVYNKQNKTEEAIKLLQQNSDKFKKSPYEYLIYFRIAELSALEEKKALADINYNIILENNPSYNLTFLSKVRLNLLQRDLLKNYLEGNDSVKYNILVKLNKDSLDYNLIPVILNLSEELKLNYRQVIKNFSKTFIIDNLESSYAAYKLSRYMLANKDYPNARKYAALALRYKGHNPFYTTMKEHYEKTNWFFQYADSLFNVANNDLMKSTNE